MIYIFVRYVSYTLWNSHSDENDLTMKSCVFIFVICAKQQWKIARKDYLGGHNFIGFQIFFALKNIFCFIEKIRPEFFYFLILFLFLCDEGMKFKKKSEIEYFYFETEFAKKEN